MNHPNASLADLAPSLASLGEEGSGRMRDPVRGASNPPLFLTTFETRH
jgi:hypothetical protein